MTFMSIVLSRWSLRLVLWTWKCICAVRCRTEELDFAPLDHNPWISLSPQGPRHWKLLSQVRFSGTGNTNVLPCPDTCSVSVPFTRSSHTWTKRSLRRLYIIRLRGIIRVCIYSLNFSSYVYITWTNHGIYTYPEIIKGYMYIHTYVPWLYTFPVTYKGGCILRPILVFWSLWRYSSIHNISGRGSCIQSEFASRSTRQVDYIV